MKTPLVELLKLSARDLAVTIDQANAGELESAISGMDTVIQDLKEVRDATRRAVDGHRRFMAEIS